jgi:dienelactone hydrolase
MTLHTRIARVLSGLSFCLVTACGAASEARFTGPWNMKALQQVPRATWGARTGLVQQVVYEGERYEGHPTRIFAWYGRPAEGNGPFPAMVLVHGGGGKAFAEWATLWAQRGYAALAMDTAGQGSDGKPMEDGGPGQVDTNKFRIFLHSEVKEMWTYHAVAAVVRGHSLLASRPEVDPHRIGITGISWGGYLTCIVSGIDNRLKVSIPVYGCGFLHDNSAWLGRFEALGNEAASRWVNYFDPSRYLPGVRCPILFVNGTTDFAYPLDSYQKSYRQIPGRADLCITVGMKHGHPAGWAPKEIGLFADSILLKGDPLPRFSGLKRDGDDVSVSLHGPTMITKASLHYTTDEGAWQKRAWRSVDAALSGNRVTVKLPSARPLVYFLTATDNRDATVSTPHEILGAK